MKYTLDLPEFPQDVLGHGGVAMSKEVTRRLGRGLSSLISVPETPSPDSAADATSLARESAQAARVEQLSPNAFQPRKVIDPTELKALAESIRTSGILQPIVVRRRGANAYEIVAGERRWRAAQIAGLSEVPITIREATDEQMLEWALVENIFREDLNPIERALGYRQYCDQFGFSAEQVAQRLGEDRSTVANYLRLLELPSDVKEWVASSKLSMGHARCLLALKVPSEVIQLAKQVMDRELSVRAVEKLVRERVEARATAAKPPAEAKDAKRPQIRSLEQSFAQALGTKVEIAESRRKGSGKIVIHYASLDDFDRVVERLGVSTE